MNTCKCGYIPVLDGPFSTSLYRKRMWYQVFCPNCGTCSPKGKQSELVVDNWNNNKRIGA